MRTSKQFNATLNNIKWFVNFHQKPCWLVPARDRYLTSCIEPKPGDLPRGTSAVCFNVDMDIIKSVASSKTYSI